MWIWLPNFWSYKLNTYCASVYSMYLWSKWSHWFVNNMFSQMLIKTKCLFHQKKISPEKDACQHWQKITLTFNFTNNLGHQYWNRQMRPKFRWISFLIAKCAQMIDEIGQRGNLNFFINFCLTLHKCVVWYKFRIRIFK